MFVFEQTHERHGQNQRIAGENQPHALPVGDAVNGIHFNHFPAGHTAEDAAKAVGHHQEHTLRTGADFWFNFFLHEHRTGDVEEVESASVDNHRQHQQDGTEG